MTGTRANLVLRHIRDFAAAESADGDLLERFATSHEEEAFAVLVRRHGPLVLGVCRRLLHNSSDADDAFQATFLALARQAGSAGRCASLGTWLYRVAYRTALKARSRADARRRREQLAAPRPQSDPLAEVTGRELLTVLDEELQRLPERLRAPLVLCYLQGKTRDEAAHDLSCSLGTVKRLLEQGRTTLQARLSRRGISLAALLAAGVGGTIVSPGLAAVTSRMAAGALRTLSCFSRRVVGVALLAAGLAAVGMGVVAYRAPAAGAAVAQETMVVLATPAQPPPAAPAEEKKQTIIRGRVVDAAGKAAADADVALVGMPRFQHPFASRWLEEKVLAQARADAEGHFRIGLADEARGGYEQVYALAGKEGHGLTWGKVPRPDDATDIVLRLSAEKVIRGRVLDLQGLASAGVEVRLDWLGTAGDVRRVDFGISALSRDQFPSWPGPTKTDRDGRFVLRRLSAALEGHLTVEGDAYAPAHATFSPGAVDKTQEMKIVVVPALVLEGVVTAEDTCKPVPGARVRAWTWAETRTDEKGRYRVKPEPEGTQRLAVDAPDGQPYLPAETTVNWPRGAVRHEVNLVLPRGVLVRGKLTDLASGGPIAGAVVHDGTQLWMRSVKSASDGSFALAVPPGRSHLLVKGPNNDYIAMQITSALLGRDTPPYYRLYPDALIPLDLKAGAAPVDVSAKLRRGVTLRGRVLGPDEKPVEEAVLFCWNQLPRSNGFWFASPVAVRDGEFELRGCDPEETYPVHFLEARHQWGASVKVSAKEVKDKPLVVRLERCGRVAVRFVNKSGKPVPGVSPYVYVICRPGEKDVGPDSDFVANVDRINYTGGGGPASDGDGHCTFPALIPGVTYRLFGPRFKDTDIAARAGETVQGPDIVVE
jgi:RNA polymerase sigma factor (sigma-70 family)